MAAQHVGGNNNRTVTVQVLASSKPSAYSTMSVRPEVRLLTSLTTASIDHTTVNRVSFYVYESKKPVIFVVTHSSIHTK